MDMPEMPTAAAEKRPAHQDICVGSNGFPLAMVDGLLVEVIADKDTGPYAPATPEEVQAWLDAHGGIVT